MHQVFTTRIYQKAIPFDLPDLTEEIYQIQKVDKDGQRWSSVNYVNGYTSYGSWDRLYLMSSTFEKLKRKIDRHVKSYVKQLHFDKDPNSIEMNSCWVNIMSRNSHHTAHIHPGSVISGTFYVQVPPKTSAIKFEDPRLGFFMNTPPIKDSAPVQEQRFFSLHPKKGDVVLFESWLRHEVPLNASKNDRISVSFNYSWK